MILFDVETLLSDLMRDEGIRLMPYQDTAGKWTIGVGRNLTDRGILRSEAELLCRNDIAMTTADLDRNAPWWRTLSSNRQRALANMTFNLGWPRLSGFKVMLAALEHGDFESAATECLNSKWAAQVGDRSQRIATLFKEG
jgi:lysozyme